MNDKFINKYFKLLSFFVILLAAFLRFVNYSYRFGIAYDQAHDALLARYAASHFLFPLVGPFSSGATFQASGIWYWFLIIPSIFANNVLIAPWVATTLYCVLFVFLVVFLGSKIVDKKFGLIAGLFAAISTSQIGQSTNLSLTALIAPVSLASIYFAYKFLKDKKNSSIFWFGFFTVLAPTIHLQGVLLVVIIPTVLIVGKVKNLKNYLYLALGMFVPLIPLLIFDLQNNFINSSSLIKSLLAQQHEVSYESLGRSWKNHLFVFWPGSWSNILGGNIWIVYITILSIIVVFIDLIRKKTIEKIWIIILATFLLDVILMRYVRSPLFDSYLNFLHPFIYFLVAYAVVKILKWKFLFGLTLLILIVGGSLYRDFSEVNQFGNEWTIKIVQDLTKVVEKKYPSESFAFYDFDYRQVDKTLPLVLFMDVSKKVNDEGTKIGIITTVDATKSATMFERIGRVQGYDVMDLTSSQEASLAKHKWHPVNPSYIYHNTEDWNNK